MVPIFPENFETESDPTVPADANAIEPEQHDDGSSTRTIHDDVGALLADVAAIKGQRDGAASLEKRIAALEEKVAALSEAPKQGEGMIS